MVTRWSPRGFSQAICSTPIIAPASCCGFTLVCVGPYFWNGLPLVRAGSMYQAPKYGSNQRNRFDTNVDQMNWW